jgi:hypothetical protein
MVVRFAKGDGGIYILLVAIPLKDRLLDDEAVNRDFHGIRVDALAQRAPSPDHPTNSTLPVLL